MCTTCLYHLVKDANGMTWRFDGSRVYCLEAELEMKNEPELWQDSENGYVCSTYEEALDILKEGGYLDPDS